jgi:hypothetical protein
LISGISRGQEDLLKELETSQPEGTDYTIQTFKGTRILNGHSVETKPQGALEFIINHRFGAMHDAGNFYGLDNAYIRLGLEYGITDRLGIALGRSSHTKEYDAYLKYKVLRQATGEKSFPFTMTLFGGYYYINSTFAPYDNYSTSDRMAYAAQAMIARKFSPGISFQVSPTLLHRNTVDQSTAVNDLFALGFGGRIKITRSVSLNLEYYARLNENENNPYYNPYGIGIDIETGGHVFQMVFTNSIGSMERLMLTETGEINNDEHPNPIHFGFNITRTFQLAHRK